MIVIGITPAFNYGLLNDISNRQTVAMKKNFLYGEF